MLPCTFDTMIDDDVLAKAFWITVIIRMPGARKWRNGTPITGPRDGPIASAKTAMNSPAVTSGASSVWVQTARKRLTSRPISVRVPRMFQRPKRRVPMLVVSIIRALPPAPSPPPPCIRGAAD